MLKESHTIANLHMKEQIWFKLLLSTLAEFYSRIESAQSDFT